MGHETISGVTDVYPCDLAPAGYCDRDGCSDTCQRKRASCPHADHAMTNYGDGLGFYWICADCGYKGVADQPGELVVKAKIPDGATEVLIRIPYEPGPVDLQGFEPKDVSVDFRDTSGFGPAVWTPAELTGTDVVQRYLQ